MYTSAVNSLRVHTRSAHRWSTVSTSQTILRFALTRFNDWKTILIKDGANTRTHLWVQKFQTNSFAYMVGFKCPHHPTMVTPTLILHL